jgi:hypothetical protein
MGSRTSTSFSTYAHSHHIFLAATHHFHVAKGSPAQQLVIRFVESSSNEMHAKHACGCSHGIAHVLIQAQRH